MISLPDMMCGAKLGNCLHGTTAAHHSTGQKGRAQVLRCHDTPVAALRLLPPRPPAPLQWHAGLCHGTVLYWPCLGTDNLSRSGGSGQLKTANGQNEGCSATQWLNTFSSYLRPTGLPGLGHLCRRVRQNGCQGMPIFPELPCSWSD